MSMKKLAVAGALLLFAARSVLADPITPADQVSEMQRGVNIVGYDPLWHDASKARFTPRLFKTIKDGGFSSVRMVLQAFQFMDADNKLPESWFATLDGLVKAALEQDLDVILDEHDFGACGANVSACRPKLMAFWTQVSERYKDAPEKVVFEILNEPNRAANDSWNDMHAEALSIIRKTNPTRNVIIGPAFWNNTGWLDKLDLPVNDRHIIVTVHYYTPMKFTHQGASWTPEFANTSGITWGSPADRALLVQDFDAVQAWSKKNDRPILLGEFGAYDKAPIESRVAYTSAVARAAEERGWAWAYWQFDGDFIVYDIDKDAWVKPIHDALVPPPKPEPKPAENSQ
jgi:endoglucanase